MPPDINDKSVVIPLSNAETLLDHRPENNSEKHEEEQAYFQKVDCV